MESDHPLRSKDISVFITKGPLLDNLTTVIQKIFTESKQKFDHSNSSKFVYLVIILEMQLFWVLYF